MGVIKWFSSDSRDTSYPQQFEASTITNVERVNSTPDPIKFEIKKKVIINGFPIYWVQYLDVTNYEGNKILMYPKYFDTGVLRNRMDPHFFTKGDSPIARFEPTAFGWKLAETLAKNL